MSQHIYIFPFVYSTFVYISTYFPSPCPIALVLFGIDVIYLNDLNKLQVLCQGISLQSNKYSNNRKILQKDKGILVEPECF